MRALFVLFVSANAWAVGEEQGGFPNWSERVIHQWMNRARADPGVEMTACGAKCGEAACYQPVQPLTWDEHLAHAARFHADEMQKQGYFAHDSICTLVQNIGALYPSACDGSAACACSGGQPTCTGTCTSFSGRIGLFGGSASGEIIASSNDPDSAFYQWLFEPSSATACAYSGSNGHRYNILTSKGGVGVGVTTSSVGDFSFSGAAPAQVASGSHYPRQAAKVEFWANWFDTSGPKRAAVDIAGSCSGLELQRGDSSNGAWSASVSGLETGCHRYYFEFVAGDGSLATYPTTGSLGVGPADCADWSADRPDSCVNACADCQADKGGKKVAPGCSFGATPAGPATLLWVGLLYAWTRRRR